MTTLTLLDADLRPSRELGVKSLPLLRDDLRPSILGPARDHDFGGAAVRPAAPAQAPSDRPSGGSRPLTLDAIISDAWEGLTGGRRAVSCFVCGGHMSPRWGAVSAPVGGRCDDCGSTLS